MGQGCPGEDTGQTVDIEELKTKVGQPIGTSEWVEVGQDRIEAFAETTLDFDPIHVDPQAAHNAGFEGTIAHGFLSLSLLAPFYKSGYPKIERRSYGLNYGLNRVRFLAPVLNGKRVRGHFKLIDLVERAPNRYQLTSEVSVEIEHEEKPALVAEWLTFVEVEPQEIEP
ncbi:MAG: MaoC family dehydratase [Novosphingobium sp.]|nr:MaoC family dehydratase [Novosphingobium sp.]